MSMVKNSKGGMNMKKTKLILLILCMSLVLSTFASCAKKELEETEPISETSEIPTETSEPPTEESKLTEEELIAKMIEDAKKSWGDGLYKIVGPWGIFDDKIAVCILPTFLPYDPETITVAGKDFKFETSTIKIYIYYDGTFTTLEKAYYEDNLISEKDVEVIYDHYLLRYNAEYILFEKFDGNSDN